MKIRRHYKRNSVSPPASGVGELVELAPRQSEMALKAAVLPSEQVEKFTEPCSSPCRHRCCETSLRLALCLAPPPGSFARAAGRGYESAQRVSPRRRATIVRIFVPDEATFRRALRV